MIDLGFRKLGITRMAHAREEYLELNTRVTDENSDFEKEISAMETPIQEARSKVDSELLEIFDRLQPSLGSNVLVSISGDNCGGCHTSLAPNVIDKIRQDSDIVLCNFCGRVLGC